MAINLVPMSESKIDVRESLLPYPVLILKRNVMSSWEWFFLMPLRVSLSYCEEHEPVSSENVLYVCPMDFLVGFYIPLDSLARELLILTKVQPYHFTPNSWCMLGVFRYFSEKLGLELGLDDLLHLSRVWYSVQKKQLVICKHNPPQLLGRVPGDRKENWKERMLKVKLIA